MPVYVFRNGKLIEKDKAESADRPWSVGVISDTMPETKHHGTGRVHTSKAKFRADTRAIGATEIGNEPIRPRAPVRLDRGQRREAIRKAIYDLKNGHRPPQLVSDD